jgi:hypothetical protein
VGVFREYPGLATVRGRPLQCVVCGGREFWDREVKLNSTGMELLGLGWANQSALGLICAMCGYVHEFIGNAVQLWQPQHGAPAQPPVPPGAPPR